jgi:hypothetical protein
VKWDFFVMLIDSFSSKVLSMVNINFTLIVKYARFSFILAS